MTPVYIIAAIVILLTALVCYVFIAQQLEKKRKQRLRLLQALHLRQQLFRNMVTSFPPGFLPAELNTLVYRILIATCEQLAKLEPKVNHAQEAEELARQLAEAPTVGGERSRIEGEPAVLATRSLLQELQRFLITWSERGQISKPQAAKHSAQIRHLILQVTIDGHLQQAKIARQDNKLKLAVHHYSLARQQLLKEASQQNVQKQVDQISALIHQLENQMGNAATAVTTTAEDDQEMKAWEELENEDNWKKKQLYD